MRIFGPSNQLLLPEVFRVRTGSQDQVEDLQHLQRSSAWPSSFGSSCPHLFLRQLGVDVVLLVFSGGVGCMFGLLLLCFAKNSDWQFVHDIVVSNMISTSTVSIYNYCYFMVLFRCLRFVLYHTLSTYHILSQHHSMSFICEYFSQAPWSSCLVAHANKQRAVMIHHLHVHVSILLQFFTTIE